MKLAAPEMACPGQLNRDIAEKSLPLSAVETIVWVSESDDISPGYGAALLPVSGKITMEAEGLAWSAICYS